MTVKYEFLLTAYDFYSHTCYVHTFTTVDRSIVASDSCGQIQFVISQCSSQHVCREDFQRNISWAFTTNRLELEIKRGLAIVSNLVIWQRK